MGTSSQTPNLQTIQVDKNMNKVVNVHIESENIGQLHANIINPLKFSENIKINSTIVEKFLVKYYQGH